MSRAIWVATLLALAVGIAGCSSARRGSGSTRGDADVAAGTPCAEACCCRSRDGYYVRYRCVGTAECAAAGGECLEAGTVKCNR